MNSFFDEISDQVWPMSVESVLFIPNVEPIEDYKLYKPSNIREAISFQECGQLQNNISFYIK
jgi:hypothetical protein